MNSDSENRVIGESRVYKNRPLLLMFGVSVFYALLIGVGVCLLDFSNGYSIGCLAYPVAIASFALVGAWPVMGVGNILARTLIAISFGLAVMLGLFSGIFIVERFMSIGFFGADSNGLYRIFALSCFTISIIVQIPFWLLRIASGSHWCFEGEGRKPLISLRDMFFLMLIFSLAISASQWASRLVVASVLDSVSVGSEQFRIDPESNEYRPVMVTEENLEQMREETLQNTTTQSPLLATLYFLIPATFTLPIFWWVFRCKRFLSSWLLTMAYGVAMTAAVLLLIYALGGGGDLDFEMSFITTFAVVSTLLLIWLPLVLMRLAGLELRTKRHDYSGSPAS